MQGHFKTCGRSSAQGHRDAGAMALGVGSGRSGDDARFLGRCSVVDGTEPTCRELRTKTARTDWVKPLLVCQIRFTEWTRDDRLRQPVFLGIREDKYANEVEVYSCIPASAVNQSADLNPHRQAEVRG